MAKYHRNPTGMRNPNDRELSARVVRRSSLGFDELTRAFIGIAAARAEAAAQNETRRDEAPVSEEVRREASA